MPSFTLPDGKVIALPSPATGLQVAEAIGPGLARKAIGVKLDGTEVLELSRPITRDCAIRIITAANDDADALMLLRHSTAHVLAEAVCLVVPGTKLAYGCLLYTSPSPRDH
jgi:threonyl-tRNA synthetase